MNAIQYNEQGFAFAINKFLTEYAQESQMCGNCMEMPSLGKHIVVLDVFSKDVDTPISHLLFDTSVQKPIDEATGLEAMAVCIDKHKLAMMA